MNGPDIVKSPETFEALSMPLLPETIYLCQVSERMSCGACCGLYNGTETSRNSLLKRLAFQTERFRKVARTMEAIDVFRETMEKRDSDPPLYPDFYRCPFLGLIGKTRSCVGCLLHPDSEGNCGIDYRGLSFYGGLACREYFCPACHQLAPNRKAILKAICTDWHLYGLVITDLFFVNAFFSEIEGRLRRTLDMNEILPRSEAAGMLYAFLKLKLDWPFRGPGWRGPGTYFFNDRKYPPMPIDYPALGCPPSRFDRLFQALGSAFESKTSLERGERTLSTFFSELERCFNAPIDSL